MFTFLIVLFFFLRMKVSFNSFSLLEKKLAGKNSIFWQLAVLKSDANTSPSPVFWRVTRRIQVLCASPFIFPSVQKTLLTDVRFAKHHVIGDLAVNPALSLECQELIFSSSFNSLDLLARNPSLGESLQLKLLERDFSTASSAFSGDKPYAYWLVKCSKELPFAVLLHIVEHSEEVALQELLPGLKDSVFKNDIYIAFLKRIEKELNEGNLPHGCIRLVSVIACQDLSFDVCRKLLDLMDFFKRYPVSDEVYLGLLRFSSFSWVKKAVIEKRADVLFNAYQFEDFSLPVELQVFTVQHCIKLSSMLPLLSLIKHQDLCFDAEFLIASSDASFSREALFQRNLASSDFFIPSVDFPAVFLKEYFPDFVKSYLESFSSEVLDFASFALDWTGSLKTLAQAACLAVK